MWLNDFHNYSLKSTLARGFTAVVQDKHDANMWRVNLVYDSLREEALESGLLALSLSIALSLDALLEGEELLALGVHLERGTDLAHYSVVLLHEEMSLGTAQKSLNVRGLHGKGLKSEQASKVFVKGKEWRQT